MGPLLDLVQLISQWMALRVTGGEQIDFKCGKIRKHTHDFAGIFLFETLYYITLLGLFQGSISGKT